MPKVVRSLPRVRADPLEVATASDSGARDKNYVPVLHEKTEKEKAAAASWADRPSQLKKKDKRELKTKSFLQSIVSKQSTEQANQNKSEKPKGLLTLTQDIASVLPSETEMKLARVENELSSIQGTLAKEAAADAAARGGAISQTVRAKVRENEKSQMRLVLSHPAFQADPQAALREHMANELAMQKQAHILKKQLQKEKQQKAKVVAFPGGNPQQQQKQQPLSKKDTSSAMK